MPLEDRIQTLSHEMNRLGTGPLAELRRMQPGGPGCMAFWSLAAAVDGLDDKQHIDAWMRLMQIMAILTPKGSQTGRMPVHDTNRALGAVLCDGGAAGWVQNRQETPTPAISETRLMRFLAESPESRARTLVRFARMLARIRDPKRGVNCTEIAALLLHPGSANLQEIARSYYRRLDRAASGAELEDQAK